MKRNDGILPWVEDGECELPPIKPDPRAYSLLKARDDLEKERRLADRLNPQQRRIVLLMADRMTQAKIARALRMKPALLVVKLKAIRNLLGLCTVAAIKGWASMHPDFLLPKGDSNVDVLSGGPGSVPAVRSLRVS